MSIFRVSEKIKLPPTPPWLITATSVLILAMEPVVVISSNELLSITKLIEPPSSPAKAPLSVLELLIKSSVPSTESISVLTSKALSNLSFGLKLIPTRVSLDVA